MFNPSEDLFETVRAITDVQRLAYAEGEQLAARRYETTIRALSEENAQLKARVEELEGEATRLRADALDDELF